MTIYTHSLPVQALDALLEALDLPLDALDDLLCRLDVEPPDLAEQIVDAVERLVGRGLEESPYATTVTAVRQVLTHAREPALPAFAPNAFLQAEMTGLSRQNKSPGDRSRAASASGGCAARTRVGRARLGPPRGASVMITDAIAVTLLVIDTLRDLGINSVIGGSLASAA